MNRKPYFIIFALKNCYDEGKKCYQDEFNNSCTCFLMLQSVFFIYGL